MDTYKPGEYGTLTPNPEGEKEEKRKKSKRTVIALAGLAALLAVGGCCVGSGLVQKIVPQREEETVVVEPADDVYVAPTPTEYIVPLSPTPTEAVQEPADVREGWFGTYEGTATGRRESDVRNTIDVDEIDDGELLWLQIMPPEHCSLLSYCDENRSWGLDLTAGGCNTFDLTGIRLYLPENLSDAPGLTITDDTITIAPTEEHPYELVIEKVDGQLEGRIQTGWIQPEGHSPERWTVDYLRANRTTIVPLGFEPPGCR